MSTLVTCLPETPRPGFALAQRSVGRSADFALLGVVCLVWFFLGLGRGELWRTEGLRALVAQEMLTSGDWIVPRLYGEAHFTKPPGFYLAIVFCSLPAGAVTELTARLPSALAATASVFLFAWYFGRRLGRRTGLAAGLILPASALWLDKAGAAEIDMLQVAWVSAAILFFLRATEDVHELAWGWWLAALGCVAGGFLTKWTAPQFFYFMAVPYLALQGRLRLLRSAPHLVALGLACAVAAVWIGEAIRRTGAEIFFTTVLQEFRPRFVPAYYEEPFSPGAALTLPLKLAVTMLPWSLVALPALQPTFAKRLDEPGRQLWLALHCWAWPSIAFWMLAHEHTARHSFPALPAIAGLATLVWHTWSGRTFHVARFAIRPGHLLVASCATWLLIKLGFAVVVVPQRTAERQSQAKAASLAEHVPAGATLHHCFWNRNESLLFYYGRPLRRLKRPEDLASAGRAEYLLLPRAQWFAWSAGPEDRLAQLRDEKGEPMVLVAIPALASAPSTRENTGPASAAANDDALAD
jgi:4-amino-4-deoxy-L-arabinose transferase-like glycosyltransferase